MENCPALGSPLGVRGESVQCTVHGNNGALQHTVIRFTGGQTLHLQSRPAKNAGDRRIGMSESLEHLIARAGNNGQHGQMEKETKEIVVDRHKNIEHEEEQNGNHHDNEKESGAASGMQTGKRFRILRRQRCAGFMIVDGFMLSPVILECALDIRNGTGKEHITDQNQNFDNAGDEGIAQRCHAGTAEQGLNACRDRHEETDRKDDSKDNGHTHDDFVHAFAQLFGEPFFELGGLFIKHTEHFGGIFECTHAGGKHGCHIDHAAQERIAHPFVLFTQRHILLILNHNGMIRAADGDGYGARRTHHNPFHNSLAADIDTRTTLRLLIAHSGNLLSKNQNLYSTG